MLLINKGVKHIFLSEYILSKAINLDSENCNRLNKDKSIQAYKIVNAVRECNLSFICQIA
jgi:hypothetical protein